MSLRSTTEIQRQAPSAVLGAILNKDSSNASRDAASRVIAEAASYGLGMRDYLRLAIDPRLEDDSNRGRYAANDGKFVNGYEAALTFLNLPVRDDLDGGIMLQAAADTFQTFTGARMLFPEVIDDMVKWRYRQTNFETTDGIVAQTRTVNGTELLSTIIEDTEADYEDHIRAIPERGRVPIHAIQASQQSVKFYKFGQGYKTSYEFNRRVGLDYMTPYAIRTQRQIERSKVAAATNILVNGDGVNGASPVVNAASFSAAVGSAAVAGKLSVPHMVAWLVDRAKLGTPVDTVIGNWDMYLQWLLYFQLPTSQNDISEAERMARAGVQVSTGNKLDFDVKFQLSGTAAASQLIGFSQGDTIEELVEAGSLISESEQAIQTQEVTYVRTENSGYRLVFNDTRSILNLNAG
jgi:hypothetical protein